MSREDSASPTAMLESIILTLAIDAKEKRDVMTGDVPNAFIQTEMTDHLPDAAKELFLNNIAMKRPGSPQDVAEAVLFLASDGAAYITGQVLAIDGGLSI